MSSASGFEGRRAVVFGGQGFIGSHVVDALVSAGADVVSFDLREPDGVIPGVRAINGDITDASAVSAAIEGADHVFALAGGLGAMRSIANPVLDLATSCTAQLVLLDAVRAAAPGASVVFAGSRLEYGQPERLPVDEAHPLRPESPYAIHKAACSAYYRLYASLYELRTTILRLPNPYGVHAQGISRNSGFGILNLFVDTALEGGCIQLYGGGSQLRDFVHVDDVVEAAMLASVTPSAAGEVLNIGSGDPHSLREAAEFVIDRCGRGTIDYEAAWPDAAAAVETGDFYFDIAKASNLLGWRPRIGFLEGLSGVVTSMRNHRNG